MNIDVLSGISRNEGGLFYSVRWLSRALLDAGADIRIVSHIDEFTQADIHLWEPLAVELHRVWGPLLSSRRLRSILRNPPADLLHVHGIWLDRQWASLQWQQRTGRPVVISPRGMLDPWAVKNSAWKKKLAGALFANRSLHSATCIHALCRSEADSIRAFGLDNPIALIPNGVDLPDLVEREPNTEKKRLLFLGRIHPKKGLTELVDAWAQAGLKDWELLIAGWDDGNHMAGLQAQAEAAGCSDSISFTGPTFGAAKEIQLRSVDAFILPSFSEGLPMSVLEAWSYSLPVVMTDFCNIPAGFHAGAALRVEPNPVSVAEGLRQLDAMSEDELTGMGQRGRQLVEQEFTWQRIAHDMKAVYEWCLGGDRPACIQDRAGVR